MSEKEDAERAAWLADVKKDFASDPDALAALDRVFSHPAANERFYRGTLRQQEFHRRLNEVNDEKTRLQRAKAEVEEASGQMLQWYQQEAPKNEALMKHREVLEREKAALEAALLARGEEPRKLLSQPQQAAAASVDQALQQKIEHLEQQLAGMNNALPLVLRDTLSMVDQIRRENWEIDPGAVLDYSLQRGVRAGDALAALTADQRQKRLDAEIEKRVAAAKEEAKRELMAAHPTSDFTRATPRYHRIEEMQKAMDALGNRESRREAAIAEARSLFEQGVRD